MSKKLITIIGDHYAHGPRDLCGFPSRLFTELSSREPDTCWAIFGGGYNGGIRSVKDRLSKTIMETFSFEVDDYTAIIWVGIGETKSGGIPYDAWKSMLTQMVCMWSAADLNVVLIKPVVPPSNFIDKHMRRWIRRTQSMCQEVASKNRIQCIEVDLQDDDFVDLYSLSARGYQRIAGQVADSLLGIRDNEKEARIIYKHKKQLSGSIAKEKAKGDSDAVVITQPDRVKGSGRGNG